MNRQPETTQLVYSQLLDLLLGGTIPRQGLCFVAREVRGHEYAYLQQVVGSVRRSYYLGRLDEVLSARIAAVEAQWQAEEADVAVRQRLVAMLRAGGALTLPTSHARVLSAVAQAGVFLSGGVLVGSHAFVLYGNMLGVRWDAWSQRTQDVDLAHDSQIHAAVPRTIVLEDVLRSVDKHFFPVPSLNRYHPSTSFKLRGSELSVSLLTPMGRGRPDSTPRPVPALGAMAEPLAFLEYLLVDPQPAALPYREGVLVMVPSPARFALHKLVVSRRRPAAWANKARKDVAQARELLEILLEDDPGQVAMASVAAHEMPDKFRRQLREGAGLLPDGLRQRVLDTLDSTQSTTGD